MSAIGPTHFVHTGLPDEHLVRIAFSFDSTEGVTESIIPRDPETYSKQLQERGRDWKGIIILLGSYVNADVLQEYAKDKDRTITILTPSPERDLLKYKDCRVSVRDRMGALPKNAPWWVSRLLLRATEKDPKIECLHRGIVYDAKRRGDALPKAYWDLINKWSDEMLEQIRARGEIVQSVLADQAVAILAHSPAKFKTDSGLDARVIFGPWEPVFAPLQLSILDTDVSMFVRYDHAGNRTYGTIMRKDASVDLSFVTKAPFHGGGEADVVGFSLSGIVESESMIRILRAAV